jgi:hypothetical protein
MLLGEIPRVLARRWYIVLLGLVATGGMIGAALIAVPPTYAVSSELLLLPPSSVVPAGSNPYLALGGLESIGSVASKAMTDDRTRRLVTARFGDIDYGVGLDPTAAAPMVVIEVESKSPTVSRDAERFLSARLPTVLLELQDVADVSAKARISSTSIIEPDLPKVQRKSQIRAAVVMGAVGLLGTVLVAAALDALLLRRPRRRDDQSPSDPRHMAHRSHEHSDEQSHERSDKQSDEQQDERPDERSGKRPGGGSKARGRSAGRAEDLTRVSG